MEEQEYTWHQIAGQVNAVLNQHRALVKMHEMMRKAAQVEEYLAEHEATAARMEEALKVQHLQLVEAAEDYKELQEAIGADKRDHQTYMTTMRRNQQEAKKDCDAAVKTAEAKANAEIQEHQDHLWASKIDIANEQELAQVALDLLYDKLEEADRKLAALRESL